MQNNQPQTLRDILNHYAYSEHDWMSIGDESAYKSVDEALVAIRKLLEDKLCLEYACICNGVSGRKCAGCIKNEAVEKVLKRIREIA